MRTIHEHKRKFLIGTAVLASVLLCASLMLAFGVYPIATANGGIITTHRFDENVEAASTYYTNIMKTYTTENAGALPPKLSLAEIRASVMNQLIEAEIIHQALKKETGSDREYLVNNKVSKYEENSELKKAAPALAGMTFKAFRAEVLVPQAERDIVAGRLYLEGRNMDEWLAEQKKSAKVKFFTSEFKWTGEKVEVK